jgi:LacI family transcriptional regulator
MAKQTRKGMEPQPGQVVSLRTLGEYLNLSATTISLVLNNAPGVRSIPQETRDRVVAAAEKFDYRPHFYARSLRKQQTFSIGVLVPRGSWPASRSNSSRKATSTSPPAIAASLS